MTGRKRGTTALTTLFHIRDGNHATTTKSHAKTAEFLGISCAVFLAQEHRFLPKISMKSTKVGQKFKGPKVAKMDVDRRQQNVACGNQKFSDLFELKPHQSELRPEHNKFHQGNGDNGKHYWITPPELFASLHAEFQFTYDPCPWPLPPGFDGLTQPWGSSSYVNPPFGSIIHQGKKKGPTAWVRKAIAEHEQGKTVVLVYPVDKWVLMLLKAGAKVRNLGDVRWLSTEDGTPGKGTGRHIACFVLDHDA